MNKAGAHPESVKITRGDFWKVFLASFFMQAVWNFRTLLSIGFSFCLFPIMDKLCGSSEEKRDFVQRHLQFFNAHPYFASFALGVSIRLEEMQVNGEIGSRETLEHIKNRLIGPLGAVGDKLFWATIKPGALVFGMLGVYLAPGWKWKLAALVVTFLLYNIPHLRLRYRGIVEGYENPIRIKQYIEARRFEPLRKVYLWIWILSLLGIIAAFAAGLTAVNPWLILILALSALYTYWVKKKFHNFYVTATAVFLLAIAAGILFI
ncbi:MAG: PTS system mannose/fructose/sorbose family transporter subunit IID [Calditrichia bacterium]